MIKFYNDFWQKNKEGHFFDFSFKWPLVKELVTKKKKLTILDYGCGTGKYIEELLKLNPYKIIGTDISDYAIKIAKKRFPNSKFYVIDGDEKLPVKSASVDFVLAADVIEHIFDVSNFLIEMNRTLKKGGKIFISTPYHGTIKNLVISLIGFDTAFNPTYAHIRFFTKKSLTNLLEKNGFNILAYGQYGRFKPLSRGMFFIAEKD